MFLFNKKSKQTEALSEEINKLNKQLYYKQKNAINDFILILEQIQETNNGKFEKNTWVNFQKKQLIINNEIDLAIENYRNKILELDINV